MMVSEISEDELLALLEDSVVESGDLEIERLEYAKDVSDWIAIVRRWLEAIREGRSKPATTIGGGQVEVF